MCTCSSSLHCMLLSCPCPLSRYRWPGQLPISCTTWLSFTSCTGSVKDPMTRAADSPSGSRSTMVNNLRHLASSSQLCRSSCKWLTLVPKYIYFRIVMTCGPSSRFLMTCMYTKNNPNHFVINFISLLIVLLPKLPQFHGVRLFGINKY